MSDITEAVRRLEIPKQAFGIDRAKAISDLVALVRATESTEDVLLQHGFDAYKPNVKINRFARLLLKEQYNVIVADI